MFSSSVALGALGILGGLAGASSARSASSAANRRADYYARNFVQIRAADARKAGISPLYALGAPAIQPDSSMVGADRGLSQAGQDLSRMAAAYADHRQRQAVIDLELKKGEADVKNTELKNAILSTQLSQQLQGPSLSPDPGLASLGILGQGDTVPYVTVAPSRGSGVGVARDLGVDYSRPEVPYSSSIGVEAGIRPFYQSYIDQDGEVWKVPSSELAESMENNLVLQAQFAISEAERIFGSWWNRVKLFDPRLKVDVLKELSQRQPAAPEGYVFRWSFGNARWKLEPQRYSGDRYPVDPNIKTLRDLSQQILGR